GARRRPSVHRGRCARRGELSVARHPQLRDARPGEAARPRVRRLLAMDTRNLSDPLVAPQLAPDPLWYMDAIIYQLHVKAFHDSDGDGIGDFRGLTEKLDYIRDLGVNTVWVMPFYPSPLRDDGYDVADFESVHPPYGTVADFKRFVRAAHER